MKKLSLNIFFLFSFSLIGQINLVLNPSFEILDSCPSGIFQISNAIHWNQINSSPPCQAHLASTCSIEYHCTLPSYWSGGGKTYQWPKSGNSYCALTVYTPPIPAFNANFRTYTMGTLSSILINGKVYCGKFYVNLDNTSAYKCNRLGMYFDNGSILGTQINCNSTLGVASHIDNNSIFIMNDTLNWMKIEGTYISNGTENNVTIGNFSNTSQTTAFTTGFTTSLGVGLYNIDDISLIPIEIKAFAGNDITICNGDSIELGRPQEVGLECLWYTPGNTTPFATTSNFSFKPTQVGNFTFIQKMDNCQISFDTVNVIVVEDCNQVSLPIIDQTVIIPNTFSPNGDNVNDVWYVDLKNKANVSYTIFNRWGITILQSDMNTHTFVKWDGRTTSGENVTVGVYYYVLSYEDEKGEAIKKAGYISLFK